MSSAQEEPPTPDDSNVVEFPQETALHRAGKIAASIAGIVTLIGTFVGTGIWLTGEIDAVQKAAEEETAAQLEQHLRHPHPDSVPREVYEEHIRQAEKAAEEAKTDRREIRKVLDLIGRRTYRSSKSWERAVKKEGLTHEHD